MENTQEQKVCTAFDGSHRVAAGQLSDVAKAAKAVFDRNPSARILVFDNETSKPIDIDWSGTEADVLRRLVSTELTNPALDQGEAKGAEAPRGPGRPRLGVVAREVTLLPRHWDWLNLQPGGASVALRKLVEDARRANASGDRVRQAQESAYRFMSAIAGDEAGFESATRALFAGDPVLFEQFTASWPGDVRDHARALSHAAFTS